MRKKRIRLGANPRRAVLSDMLPFEVPATFSNRHFYSFLTQNEVEVRDNRLSWKACDNSLDALMRLMFGVKPGVAPQPASVTEWGRTKMIRSFSMKECELCTIPFRFRVSHKSGARTLSIAHPRNQVMVANFYRQFHASLLYYCSLSPYSIRHPVSVSKYSYHKDSTHKRLKAVTDGGVEEAGREYEQLGSHFVYRSYSNIHKFFESYKYHRSEKKFNAMIQVDISKCFDSIYTHSIAWAIFGKEQTKHDLNLSKNNFPDKFDKLLSLMNERETNGILIGPEFSRIFAEVILQAIDMHIEKELREKSKIVHKIDYEAFRYVDDYFVFFNEESTAHKFTEVASVCLANFKLHINSAKSKLYEKPVITELTIAKDRVSLLLGEEIWSRKSPRAPDSTEGSGPAPAPLERAKDSFSGYVDANRLIVRFKTVIKESGVGYSDILNYTFAVIETKLQRAFDDYMCCEQNHDAQRALTSLVTGILEFLFFTYAASPRVNHTVRMVRIIASLTNFLNSSGVGFELRHSVYKFIHDNAVHQIEKNKLQPYREVETLYLLNALSHIGKAYWLPESTLARYFGISTNDDGQLEREEFLSYFSLTVGFSYMRDKERYNSLRKFFEDNAIAKLNYMKSQCAHHTEALMLFLDLVACPYVSPAATTHLAQIFGMTSKNVAEIRAASDQWFTTWTNLDLVAELDAKRSRDVY
ncbi:antiviral reverse transcriptase Drt3b [Caulobacter sp. 73W]|uniref:Antiviral reverse transcriptase Drt3b n=1 Tax=Caulobacter sp. 73W TaxID=3161137 RepID=A0AB39KPZ8_9CAUL